MGANSPSGFRSHFETVCPASDNWSIYVIKGGPGSGKSTLMRRIGSDAQKHKLLCEHIFCSSDPDSLDGIIIPSIKTAVFDGTAPHVIEPIFPGACENIINMGDAWSKAKLKAARKHIITLASRCSEHHKQAVCFLGCADVFRKNTFLTACAGIDRQRIKNTAQHLFSKYIGQKLNRSGSEQLRLLSAVTPKGIVTFSKTIESSCKTIIPVLDRCGAPGALLMKELRYLLLENGHEIITCLCSQNHEKTENLIIPAYKTAFTLCSDVHNDIKATERTVHTDRFISPEILSENKQRFSFNRKNSASFIQLASEEMRLAKAVHDRLEEHYISAMDFDAVGEIADKVCREIFQ